MGGGNFSPPPPVGFSLITRNGKSCNCGILQHWVKSYYKQKSQIWYSLFAPISRYWQNSDGGISDFQISGQSLIKINYQNSWTSDDTDMKLWPVTKLDKRNKMTPKKWRWRHVKKFWRHYYFSNLRPIWSNLEAAFLTQSL